MYCKKLSAESHMTKEMFVRSYLIYIACLWIVYSIFVWIRPDVLAEASGLGLNNWSATVEARAMYGGLELGMALFALAGALKPALYLRSNILMWMLVNCLLTFGRISGILVDGGTFAIDWGSMPEAWNPGALWLLEGPSALIFTWYWFTCYHRN